MWILCDAKRIEALKNPHKKSRETIDLTASQRNVQR